MKNFYTLLFILSFVLISSCERPTDFSQDDDGIPPAVPSGFRLYSASDGEIIIEWNRNSENDLEGYNVYRKIGNSDFEKIFFTPNDFYIDDSLDYNTEYFYRITAIDFAERESSPTNIISATPINRFAPRQPRFIYINARNWTEKKSMYLNWEPVEESDVAGYNIYRSDSSSFTADSLKLIGFSDKVSFEDTSDLQLYKNYYYKIKTIDKGNLLSNESSIVMDKIFGIPAVLFPSDDTTTTFFRDFILIAIEVPALYKIIVQTNQFFGEFWSSQINSTIVNDTLSIRFNPPFLEPGKKYYWRIATYSGTSSEPNSISNLYSFTFEP